MLAAAALLTFGMVSCDKDDESNSSNDNTSTTGGGSNLGTDPDTTSGEWVDLGLPSGLLWATCNLGATSPEEYGDYFAWGETQSKEVYAWNTYCFATVDEYGHPQTLAKYNISESWGTVDNLTTLEAGDDVATQVLGNGARIPTKAEWQELLDNTTAECATVNDVFGRKYTASNGNSLFLPATGYRYESNTYGDGSYGYYWTSSLYTYTVSVDLHPNMAYMMNFNYTSQGVDEGYARFHGLSVRAVRQN